MIHALAGRRPAQPLQGHTRRATPPCQPLPHPLTTMPLQGHTRGASPLPDPCQTLAGATRHTPLPGTAVPCCTTPHKTDKRVSCHPAPLAELASDSPILACPCPCHCAAQRSFRYCVTPAIIALRSNGTHTMPSTNAERQRAHRQRQRQDNHPLNTWLTGDAYRALRRLCAFHKTSQREMLERLILGADEPLRQSLSDTDFDAYLEGTLRSNGSSE